MRHLIYCSIVFFLLFVSCKKKSGEEISKEPSIEFIAVSAVKVEQFKDTVTVSLKYKDNNGDLGFESPDEYALYVKDSRLNNPDWYHVSPQAPLNKELFIEGELRIKLKPLFLLGNSKQETITYTIKIKDREGNWSNQIITPVITVHDTI